MKSSTTIFVSLLSIVYVDAQELLYQYFLDQGVDMNNASLQGAYFKKIFFSGRYLTGLITENLFPQLWIAMSTRSKN